MPSFGALKAPGAPAGMPTTTSKPSELTLEEGVRTYGGAMSPMVIPREPITPELSYASQNVRPVEGVFPQSAPDPIRRGDVPARASAMQIAIMSSPDEHVWGGWSSDHFQVGKFGPVPFGATTPQGSSQVFAARANVDRPAAAAYGSLFLISPPTDFGFN